MNYEAFIDFFYDRLRGEIPELTPFSFTDLTAHHTYGIWVPVHAPDEGPVSGEVYVTFARHPSSLMQVLQILFKIIKFFKFWFLVISTFYFVGKLVFKHQDITCKKSRLKDGISF